MRTLMSKLLVSLCLCEKVVRTETLQMKGKHKWRDVLFVVTFKLVFVHITVIVRETSTRMYIY